MASDVRKERVIAALRLVRSDRVGSRIFCDMMDVYKTPQRALKAALNMEGRIGAGDKRIAITSQREVEREWEEALAHGADFIVLGDADYPILLNHIYDAPPIITYKGNKECLNKPSIGVVGARHASAAGVSLAHQIAKELAESGYVMTSGMARGIDTAVHKGALAAKAEMSTIAVIATGIDKTYPRENKTLEEAIINEGGVVVSEQKIGASPRAENFPRRNRIISGLSMGVLVVEASLRSGSLITARMALEQGREVWAVPGFPTDANAAGPNRLIKQGAVMVENADDILQNLPRNLEEFSVPRSTPVLRESGMDYDALAEEEVESAEALEVMDIILKSISKTPASIDDIAQMHNIPMHIIQASILELELLGKVGRNNDGKIIIAT